MRHYALIGRHEWSGAPHIGQYFDAWAMPDANFRALVATILEGDLVAHIREVKSTQAKDEGPFADRGFDLIEGTNIALIELRGAMTKYGSSFSDMRHGTIGVRRAIRSAAQDDEVGAVLLRIDSPGGAVSGTGDLAADVANVAAAKPVYAYIEDLGASAAYWVASQATKVFANPSAIVGSIGTYGVVTDTSERFSREGVKVHVIRAGQFKGMGTAGTKITDEHLAEGQRMVDAINELFIAAIVKGRGLTDAHVRGIATGAVWIGADATGVGLIDGVEAIDGVIARLQGTIGASPTQTEINPMSSVATMVPPAPVAAAAQPATVATTVPPTTTLATEPVLLEARTLEQAAATTQELIAQFPDASAEWREQCVLGKLTLPQATNAWIKHLEGTLKTEKTARAEAEKSASTLTPPGAEPNTTDPAAKTAAYADPVTEWRLRVDELIKEYGGRRDLAVKAADTRHPGLRDAFVTAINQRNGTPVPQLS